MTSTTLRELIGSDQTPATLADAALLLVDFQNTYTEGVMELEGSAAAGATPRPSWSGPAPPERRSYTSSIAVTTSRRRRDRSSPP
ncbi:hypothetical protein SCALM49S_02790 [Streptomyces californicus]